jgi:Methyltransferase domain
MLEEYAKRIDEKLTSLPGWCTYDKAKRIMRVAAQSGADRCVELGVYGGRSLVAIALGLKSTGKGIVDGIDSWDPKDCLEGDQTDVDRKLWGQDTDYEDLYRRATAALKDWDVEAHARIVRARGSDAVSAYADGSLSLIHVDGNHSELVSCRDLHDWLPKMAARSTWIADDTNWASMQKAVRLLHAAGYRQEVGAEGYWSIFTR